MKTFLSVIVILSLLTIPSFQRGSSEENLNDVQADIILEGSDMNGLYNGVISYDDVALIVNDNSDISKEIGTYFASRRGLAEENIINISAPAQETINQGQFDDLADQISENLSSRGLTDSINYLVTTKGVPLRVSGSGGRAASVDSELMLVDSSNEGRIHSSGFFLNPYYQDVKPGSMKVFSRDADFDNIRLVTRLTGYTKEEAMNLVDLAEMSLDSRGGALLDMDPRKGMGGSGYGVGNQWMYDANTWLQDNGWESHLDNNNTFVTDWNDTMAYFSWGSNDGNWGTSQMSNTGFEYGTATQPTSWTVESNGGSIEKDNATFQSGSFSLNLTRNGTGTLRAYQDIDLDYHDHRIIVDGRMHLEDVTSPGARILIEGYDNSGGLIWSHELANRTGTRDWGSYQDPVENDSRIVMIRYIVELLGEGTAHFDSTNIRVIRPHNQWVAGSIAETCVSTGGRSQTYGTWYGQSLIADLIRDGVTGAKGYAYEPYLSAMSHADILFPAYYSGFNLAESFWMGSQLASWMGYVVGDPKCAPFVNERPDMGFIEDGAPIISSTDEEGRSYISIRLFNKGNTDVENGEVRIMMDDDIELLEDEFDIPAEEGIVINISTGEEEDIQGIHRFKVLLDGDDGILEFDEGNNLIVLNLTVNSEPHIGILPEASSVMRMETLNLSVSVTDSDMDFDEGFLETTVKGPWGEEFTPELTGNSRDGMVKTYDYSFKPPWNSTLGFYSINATYTDMNGSMISDLIAGAFKVLNALPTLEAEIGSDYVGRGDRFLVNLTWNDPDTPDGELDIVMVARDTSGFQQEPESFNRTSANTGSFTLEIPVMKSSGDWFLNAEITDRNGASVSWKGTIRSVNTPPDLLLVSGDGDNITRLEEASFTIRYSDPEGFASRFAELFITGPGEPGSGNTVYQKSLDLPHEEDMIIRIPGKGLAVGDYNLRIEYQDDESDGGILEVDRIFTIVPMAPNISRPAVMKNGVENDPGVTVTKGSTVSVNIIISDEDSTGALPVIDSYLTTPSGNTVEASFISKGSDLYNARIITGSNWEVGAYSLYVGVTDGDGALSNITEGILFILDADPPLIDEGTVTVGIDLNISARVSVQVDTSSSSPERMYLHLLDANGSDISVFELGEKVGYGFWQGSGMVLTIPVNASLRMIDDLGRTFWSNDTIDIDVKERVIEDTPEKGDEDKNDHTIVIVLSAIVVLVLLLILLVAVIRRKNNRMVAPPPAMPQGGTAGLHGTASVSNLPGGQGPGGNAIRSLPPGRDLRDGGSYHRPQMEKKPDPTPPIESSGTAPPEPEKTGAFIPSAPQPVETIGDEETTPGN